MTLLAVTWCEQQEDLDSFDKEKALTKENLSSFMSMLSFGKFKDDKYDTRIKGLGLDLLVSEVQNTDLKSPKVSKDIPTVAEVTQGKSAANRRRFFHSGVRRNSPAFASLNGYCGDWCR